MCGISGFIPINKGISKSKILEIVKFLLSELESRGRDATGIASWDIETTDKEKCILICKQAEEAKIFTTKLAEEHILGMTICHNRAKTQGDPEDKNNNHPIWGEKFCIIHNGVVSSMKELEDYKLKGKCDTEVLLAYLEKFGIKEAIPQISGSAAFAVFSPLDRNVYLYRHTSPLYVSYIPGQGIAFASTESPLKKIGDMLGAKKIFGLFSPQTIAEIDEGQLLTFNVDTNEMKVEEIKVEYSYSRDVTNRSYVKKT